MTTNLLDEIQKNLGYPELHKIDPNTQEVNTEAPAPVVHHLGTAAIPAVLMGLYKYGSTEHGAGEILKGSKATEWLDEFFGDKKTEAIEKVAAYSGSNDKEEVHSKMEQIAGEAVNIIRQNTPSGANFNDVKTYMADQRATILKYLPAELQIGYLLNDNTLDDRTNKMEGPMSGHMHFLEKLFSGSSSEKYERKAQEDKE